MVVAANRAARLPISECATNIGFSEEVVSESNASNHSQKDAAFSRGNGSDSPRPGTSGTTRRWLSRAPGHRNIPLTYGQAGEQALARCNPSHGIDCLMASTGDQLVSGRAETARAQEASPRT